MQATLGFIGGGNMAEAIVRAALDSGVLSPDQLLIHDPLPARREVFEQLQIRTTDAAEGVVRDAAQVMLAVKPQTLPDLADLLGGVRDDQVVISILAGKTGRSICDLAGRPLRVVRVMPNTPVLVGQGMAALALGPHAQPGDDDLAFRMFEAGGRAVRVNESQLDAVTAVSGSGPAYLFYLAEAMQQAAIDLGLADHAELLVRQTLLGAAALLAQSPDGAAELRRKVTSPGGTTQAACEHLDAADVSQAIRDAITAARDRSIELAQNA